MSTPSPSTSPLFTFSYKSLFTENSVATQKQYSKSININKIQNTTIKSITSSFFTKLNYLLHLVAKLAKAIHCGNVSYYKLVLPFLRSQLSFLSFPPFPSPPLLGHIRSDNNFPSPADLWRCAARRGHTGTKVRRYNWHSAGSVRWPFPMLKYKCIFQIKYAEAILSNNTRKLLRLEIAEMLIAVLNSNK